MLASSEPSSSGLTLKSVRDALINVVNYWHEGHHNLLINVTTINEFKFGRTSNENEARLERPIEVSVKEIVQKIHGIVQKDRQVKVREIADIVGI